MEIKNKNSEHPLKIDTIELTFLFKNIRTYV